MSASLNAQTPPGHGRSSLTDEQHKDGKNARQVARRLSQRAHGDKPFFIACGIQKPHVPFLAPDMYFDLYPPDEITFTRDRPNLWDAIPSAAMSKGYTVFGFELGKENDSLRREYMQAYHAGVSFIDAQLKIVLDALKASGQWDETVVIFTSDHGYHLGDHFLWGKVTLFDIGTKVPFLLRLPGLTKAGTTSEAMVDLIDIYPTLADLTGLTSPEHLQGISLGPVLEHPERRGKKRYAYSVVSRGQQLGYALRNQRWRYGNWPDGEELYNLANDPREKQNLAGEPHVADRALPKASPNLNGRRERFIGTIRWECLDKFIIFGKRHLDHLLAEFVAYYNEARSHSERDHLPPIRAIPEDVDTLSLDQVEVRSYVGGLVKSFKRRAA